MTENILYSFTNYATPDSALVFDHDGSMYRTQGPDECLFCDGAAFALLPPAALNAEWKYVEMPAGPFPTGFIIFGHALYGTAGQGGDLQGCNGLGCGYVYSVAGLGSRT